MSELKSPGKYSVNLPLQLLPYPLLPRMIVPVRVLPLSGSNRSI